MRQSRRTVPDHCESCARLLPDRPQTTVKMAATAKADRTASAILRAEDDDCCTPDSFATSMETASAARRGSSLYACSLSLRKPLYSIVSIDRSNHDGPGTSNEVANPRSGPGRRYADEGPALLQ